MEQSNVQSLILTGGSLGVLHVLAGPDHLSALAALSVGSSWRAINLGIKWGIGHSTGMVLVAALFIIMKQDLNIKAISRYCDSMVGLCMIILGGYGIMSAVHAWNEKMRKSDRDLEHHDAAYDHHESSHFDDMVVVHNFAKIDQRAHDVLIHDNVDLLRWIPTLDIRDEFAQRIISFSIGILHGVAGPGGVLGVLPAIEMRNWRASVAYLAAFVISSTLAMGAFAALYGELTKRIGSTQWMLDIGLRIFSAGLSILVGTVWVVLSIVGKMDDFFH